MYTDSINILKYLIIAELMLLFCAHKLGGQAGLIWAVVLSTIAICLGSIFLLSHATHVPSNRAITSKIIQVTLLFTYLGIGVAALFSTDRGFTLFSYAWLASVVIAVVMLFFVSYELSIRIKEDKAYRQELLLLQIQEKEQEAYENALSKLRVKYKAALIDSAEIESYLELSEESAKEYQKKGSFPHDLAAYTANLMLEYINKDEHKVALRVFDSYVDLVLPHSEVATSSTYVASFAIILSMRTKEPTIFDRAEEHILSNIDIKKISNSTLLFNLACHYSLKRDKEKLLLYVTLARKQGFAEEAFYSDDDFIYYKGDNDFLLAVKGAE